MNHLGRTIFTGLFGSHLYGLNTSLSDLDFKSVYIPRYRDIILGNARNNITTSTGGNTKNSPNDVDIETFSLQEFVHLASEGALVAIDMLHTPPQHQSEYPLVTSPIWNELIDKRAEFYSKDMSMYIKYIKKRAVAYQKAPNPPSLNKKSWKSMSHLAFA